MSSTAEPAMGEQTSLLQKAKKKGRKFLNPEPTGVGDFQTMLKVIWRMLTNREQRKPRGTPGPFTTDVTTYDQEPTSGLRVTWFGHSSTLLEIDGVRVLLDPVWEERASPAQWLGPRRFFPPTVELERLPVPDVILLSHDHFDHLGEHTVRTLARSPRLRDTRWVTSLGVAKLLVAWGVAAGQIAELDWTDEVTVQSLRSGASLRMRSLPARHFSGRSLWNRFETLWGSFVLEGSEHRVYFGADSGMWSGFREIGLLHGPFDLILLEIGAFDPLWKQIHLGPDGALEAYKTLGGQGLLMPVHWGLFDLALHDWRQPITRLLEVAEREGVRVWSPEPGQPTEVDGRPLSSRWWQAEGL